MRNVLIEYEYDEHRHVWYVIVTVEHPICGHQLIATVEVHSDKIKNEHYKEVKELAESAMKRPCPICEG